HLDRIDVVAADDHHIFLPVDDGEISVLVHPGHITGVKPAIAQGIAGGGIVLPVANENIVTAGDELTDLSLGYVMPVLVDDANFELGQGLSYGTWAASVRIGIGANRRRALGKAISLDDLDAGQLPESLQDRHWKRCGA